MTFLSTYSSGSIRGWQSSTGFPTFDQNQELLPNVVSNPLVQDFGSNVALSYNGNYLAVGSQEFDVTKTAGNVYIYAKDILSNTFNLQQTITPNGFPGPGNAWWFFGEDVAIDAVGATVIGGAVGYDSTSNAAGAAYIFTRTGTTWSQEAQLLSSDPNSYSFGTCVDLNYSGNLAVVGSWDDQTASQSGAVYVFNKSGNTWTKTQKLKAGNVLSGQRFGSGSSTVALTKDQNANYLVVSATGENGGTGAVYVFNKSGNTYVQQQRIPRPTSGGGSNFGRDLAINDDGNIMLVGCSDQGIAQAGKVFVYTRSGNTWSLFQTITPTTSNVNDAFGSSLALSASGNIAFVGDFTYPATSKGSVFVFEQISSYVQNQIITANNGADNDFLGTSIACDNTGSLMASGAIGKDTPNVANNTGSVYLFTS